MPISSYGYVGDVNNSIPVTSAYPGNRAAMGTPGTQTGLPAAAPMAETAVKPASNAPANSWILFFVIFAAFIWIARRYNGGVAEGSIKMTLYNGVFLTFFIVLILNLLKVAATRVRVPGVSELILAA